MLVATIVEAAAGRYEDRVSRRDTSGVDMNTLNSTNMNSKVIVVLIMGLFAMANTGCRGVGRAIATIGKSGNVARLAFVGSHSFGRPENDGDARRLETLAEQQPAIVRMAVRKTLLQNQSMLITMVSGTDAAFQGVLKDAKQNLAGQSPTLARIFEEELRAIRAQVRKGRKSGV